MTKTPNKEPAADASSVEQLIAFLPQRYVERFALAEMVEFPGNPKEHDLPAMDESMRTNGFYGTILLQDWPDTPPYILAGHGRKETLMLAGQTHAPAVLLKCDPKTARRIVLVDNRLGQRGGYNPQGLVDFLQVQQQEEGGLLGTGYDDAFVESALAQLAARQQSADEEKQRALKTLAERFGVPPFSILDARQGYWQERKRAWLALGIESDLGRGTNLLQFSKAMNAAQSGVRPYDARSSGSARAFGQDLAHGEHNMPGFQRDARNPERSGNRSMGEDYQGGDAWANAGTSVFDPVLCELAYRWWSPPGGQVLDPFAGGSVRGIVAAQLGRRYLGIDLSAEQVAANAEQAKRICGELSEKVLPTWLVGDAGNMDEVLDPKQRADFLFTCPPYFDLERYSEREADLSNMPWPAFEVAYRIIIHKACERLNNDRFACIVVADVRDERGIYRRLPELTVEAFERSGLRKYNEAVLITAVGSLPLRVGRQFQASRKLGKAHQNVLVFVKGDGRAAADHVGPCEIGSDDALQLPTPASEVADA